MDKEAVGFVSDVLENYPYRRLKEQLVKHLSVSETAKFKRLLTELTLGVRVPSLLQREMNQFGGDKVGTKLLQSF